MLRIFNEHRLRRTESLDGLWTLEVEDRRYSAWVPGVWERICDLAAYRGVASYERTVEVDRGGSLLLRFGGVSHTANVLWDGSPVAHHYNAFTGFDVLLENVSAGSHTLRVMVDNRHSDASTLHIPNDYYDYGGISRPVELHALGSAYIERLAFHAVEEAGDRFTANVRLWLRALADAEDVRVSIAVAGGRAEAALGGMGTGERRCVELSVPVEGVCRWDALRPCLYDLTATLSVGGAPIDDLIERVGFRTVRVDGERILLNGRPVRIKGFNRHEDHGQLGCALGVDAMMDDLQLILAAGANALRTCHYPNDPRFLDLCDALGLLVWEEHHARALPGELLRSPLFDEQISACNEEMIAQHVNHPCVYVWGVLNECESDTDFGRALYAKNLEQLRRLDPTRPVTFASCRHFTDVCLDLVDIVSFNIYPGWYVDEPVKDYLDRLVTWMEDNGAKGKPILISEIGAGGIAGFHDPLARAKWSEERQADILTEQLEAIAQNERLSGVYIWQFADVRVSEEWAMKRPKAMNNKGVVDAFRRPKLAYAAVRRLYTALP